MKNRALGEKSGPSSDIVTLPLSCYFEISMAKIQFDHIACGVLRIVDCHPFLHKCVVCCDSVLWTARNLGDRTSGCQSFNCLLFRPFRIGARPRKGGNDPTFSGGQWKFSNDSALEVRFALSMFRFLSVRLS